MLYYESIDASKSIDINAMSASKECIICHYWHFLDKRFKLLKDPAVCNSYLVVLMMTIKVDSLAIFIVCSIDDYHCVIVRISKS